MHYANSYKLHYVSICRVNDMIFSYMRLGQRNFTRSVRLRVYYTEIVVSNLVNNTNNKVEGRNTNQFNVINCMIRTTGSHCFFFIYLNYTPANSKINKQTVKHCYTTMSITASSKAFYLCIIVILVEASFNIISQKYLFVLNSTRFCRKFLCADLKYTSRGFPT